MRRLLQNVTILLQNATVITKCDVYYKLRQYSYTWNNIKTSYKNNKFKISAPTRNEEFQLPNGSYSVLDIQDYFEYIFKKYGEETGNLSIRLYVH